MKRLLEIIVPAMLATACAGVPPTVTEGEEELPVRAFENLWVRDPISGTMVSETREVEGVSCSLANDKGRWQATSSGKVRVERSSAPLAFECTKEGYEVRRGEVKCMTPSQRNAPMDTMDTVGILLWTPLAIAAAPVAPQIAAQAGVNALMSGAGLAASHYSASKQDANACTYRGLHLYMTASASGALNPPRP